MQNRNFFILISFLISFFIYIGCEIPSEYLGEKKEKNPPPGITSNTIKGRIIANDTKLPLGNVRVVGVPGIGNPMSLLNDADSLMFGAALAVTDLNGYYLMDHILSQGGIRNLPTGDYSFFPSILFADAYDNYVPPLTLVLEEEKFQFPTYTLPNPVGSNVAYLENADIALFKAIEFDPNFEKVNPTQLKWNYTGENSDTYYSIMLLGEGGVKWMLPNPQDTSKSVLKIDTTLVVQTQLGTISIPIDTTYYFPNLIAFLELQDKLRRDKTLKFPDTIKVEMIIQDVRYKTDKIDTLITLNRPIPASFAIDPFKNLSAGSYRWIILALQPTQPLPPLRPHRAPPDTSFVGAMKKAKFNVITTELFQGDFDIK